MHVYDWLRHFFPPRPPVADPHAESLSWSNQVAQVRAIMAAFDAAPARAPAEGPAAPPVRLAAPARTPAEPDDAAPAGDGIPATGDDMAA